MKKQQIILTLSLVIATSSLLVSCNNKDTVATINNVETSSVIETETSSVTEIESSSVVETETSSVTETELSSVTETELSSVTETETSSVVETETSSVVETETSSVVETESSTESTTKKEVSSDNRYKDPEIPAEGSEGYIMPSESEEKSVEEQSSVSVPDISITPSTPAVTDENAVDTWVDPDTGEVWVFTPNDPSKNYQDAVDFDSIPTDDPKLAGGNF